MNFGRASYRIVCMSTGLLWLSLTPAWANCTSVMANSEWPAVAHAISNARLCEQLPVGPNRTRSFKVISAEVCRNAGDLTSITAQALLTCETDDSALFQLEPIEGKVTVNVTLDTAACRITDARMDIDNGVGGLLSGLADTQDLARDWAQSQLSRLCRLR